MFPSTSKCNPSPPPPFVDPPKLGKAGKRVLNLWHDCTDAGSKNTSMTCMQVREQFNFFRKNYMDACNNVIPDFNSTIQAIYGFVQITFNGCTGGPLKDTPGFTTLSVTIATYNIII